MSMQIRRDPHHLIDVLFPAALLFVFAFSAVSVILLATGVYRDTAIHSSRSYTAEYLTGMGNIRDVIPFPRTVNNCEL